MRSHSLITSLVLPALLTLGLPLLVQAQAIDMSNDGPLFMIPNYEGDARGGDLYEYLHFTPRESWDTYRNLLLQYNAAIPPMPTSTDPTYGNGYIPGTVVGDVGGGYVSDTSSGPSSLTATGTPGVSTSVTGAMGPFPPSSSTTTQQAQPVVAPSGTNVSAPLTP